MVGKRKDLIDRLEASGMEFVNWLSMFRADEASTPPGPKEWSAREIAIHQRDTEEQVFLLRTVRALEEDHPVVSMFVQEEWEREHPSDGESLTKIIADFRAARRKLIRLLRNASSSEWNAYALHPKLGKLSVGLMAEFNYSHTLNHLAQLIDLHEHDMLRKLNE
jgi:hypothetical protein